MQFQKQTEIESSRPTFLNNFLEMTSHFGKQRCSLHHSTAHKRYKYLIDRKNVCATKGFIFFSLIVHSEHVWMFRIQAFHAALPHFAFVLFHSQRYFSSIHLMFQQHRFNVHFDPRVWKLARLMQLNFKFSWAYSTSDTLWCLFLSTLTA